MLLFADRRAKRFDHTEEGRQVRKKPASAGEVVDDREKVEAVEMGELAEASETVDLAAFVSAPPFAGPLPPSLAGHRSKSNHGRDEFLNIPPGKMQSKGGSLGPGFVPRALTWCRMVPIDSWAAHWRLAKKYPKQLLGVG